MMQTQSGRSMVEMLGVLAIVGVLSVGALAGYSMAMANYKANQAIDEIENFILGVKDLLAEPKDFNSLPLDNEARTVFISAGLFPEDHQNIYGLNLSTWKTISNSHIAYRYQVPDLSACKKILTNGWSEKLGHDLLYIRTYDGSLYHVISWDGDNVFPISVDDANTACDFMKDEALKRIYFHFK